MKPLSIFSAPRLGPTVLSSIISMGADKEPALSKRARFLASLALSNPVT
jgi:hypothetical protein